MVRTMMPEMPRPLSVLAPSSLPTDSYDRGGTGGRVQQSQARVLSLRPIDAPRRNTPPARRTLAAGGATARRSGGDLSLLLISRILRGRSTAGTPRPTGGIYTLLE